jgi:hypothetical protein
MNKLATVIGGIKAPGDGAGSPLSPAASCRFAIGGTRAADWRYTMRTETSGDPEHR